MIMVRVPCIVEMTAPDRIFPIEIWERAIGATIKDMILDFEAKNGTLNEVFLAITGKEIRQS